MRNLLILSLYLLFLNTTGEAKTKLNPAFSEKAMEVWGSDAALVNAPKQPIEKEKEKLSQKIPLSMIRFFQNHISPIDGPRSSYLPTSSEYALQAIKKYGFLTGVCLGCDRLLRENGRVWVYKTVERPGEAMRKLDPVR